MKELIVALPFFLGGLLGVGGVLFWGFSKARKARRRFWSHGKGKLLRSPGYSLFNDVPTDADCNIDHVLVGRAGVFALETKARSKTENPEGRDLVAEFDGNRITFTGGAYDTKAAKQAEAVGKWLSRELSRATGRTLVVQPVVVVPGWFVPKNNFANVAVRNPEYFAKELRDAERTISDTDIEAAAQYLEKLCRDVAL